MKKKPIALTHQQDLYRFYVAALNNVLLRIIMNDLRF
jgi:hypothetical protein